MANTNVENGKSSDTKNKKSSAKKPAKKPAAAKVASNGEGRGRKGSFDLDAKITVLAKENPKRPGSRAAKVFPLYKTGMTVQKALDAGLKWNDLNWDNKHQYIRVG